MGSLLSFTHKNMALDSEFSPLNTIVENARMEWNTALVKLPVLSADQAVPGQVQPVPGESPIQSLIRQQNYGELCKLGLALTWPVALTGLAIFLLLLIR